LVALGRVRVAQGGLAFRGDDFERVRIDVLLEVALGVGLGGVLVCSSMVGILRCVTLKALIHRAKEAGFWADVPTLLGCVTQARPVTTCTRISAKRSSVGCYHEYRS